MIYKSKTTLKVVLVTMIFGLSLVHLSSFRRECDSSTSSFIITNYCDFNVDVEVDIIGDSLYNFVLESGEMEMFYPHETRVKVKAKKSWSILTLNRIKNFESKNCKFYSIDLLQNDSAHLYRLDIDFDQRWN